MSIFQSIAECNGLRRQVNETKLLASMKKAKYTSNQIMGKYDQKPIPVLQF